MTEPDIDHAVKEILGARVVYVFAFLHLARWISVARSLRILPSWIYAPKISTGVKTLGAHISSVTFPEFLPR